MPIGRVAGYCSHERGHTAIEDSVIWFDTLLWPRRLYICDRRDSSAARRLRTSGDGMPWPPNVGDCGRDEVCGGVFAPEPPPCCCLSTTPTRARMGRERKQ